MRHLRVINGREQYVWEPDQMGSTIDVVPASVVEEIVVQAEPEPEIDGGLTITECGVIHHPVTPADIVDRLEEDLLDEVH